MGVARQDTLDVAPSPLLAAASSDYGRLGMVDSCRNTPVSDAGEGGCRETFLGSLGLVTGHSRPGSSAMRRDQCD